MTIMKVQKWGKDKVIYIPRSLQKDFELGEMVLVEKGEFVPASKVKRC